MSGRPETTPEGWPDRGGQFEVWRIDDAILTLWEEEAREEAWRLPLGRFNWPMAVRSLCAEVRRLRQGDDGLLTAAKAIVATMHARPDIWALMGFQEEAEFKRLCGAINRMEASRGE